MMEKRKNITQYRKRLNRTLEAPDLTTEESIKALVSNQLHRLNLKHETEGYNKNVIERRTAEVSNFLDMLRSASDYDNDSGRATEMGHHEWKMKHDDEEFRVMYREGPKGTPFHTLLVEGFVDGPVDICLCTSWESELYKRWWPQFTLPSFKILTSKCLQKVRIGEQISLVRVKVSWPLSTREIIVHYFLFEYFRDDLIVVLLNSISDLDSIDITTHGFTRHAIPDTEDVVRIDVVGGFAIQKVTDNRSYFRTIANMDMKLDFVPPSLINFVSRQLIGSGFRLYQKVVGSIFKSDEDFMKALKDPLYTHINEALSQRNHKVFEEKELGDQIDQTGRVHHFQEEQQESLAKEKQGNTTEEKQGNTTEEQQENLMEDQKVNGIYNAIEPSKTAVETNPKKAFGEIEEEESKGEEDRDKDDTSGRSNTEKINFKDKKISIINPDVEKALQTLDEVINMMRKCRFNTEAKAASFLSDEKPPDTEKDSEKNLSALDDSNVRPEVDLSASLLKKDTAKRASDEPPRTNSNHSSRRLGSSNSLSKDVNHNKIVPASPEHKILPPVPAEVNHAMSSFIERGTIQNPSADHNSHDHEKKPIGERNGIDEISEDAVERYATNRKNRYWCFPSSPIRMKKGRS